MRAVSATPTWIRRRAGSRRRACRSSWGTRRVGRVAALDELRYHEHLWMEREVKSVANVTGRDIREFLALSPGVPIRPEAAAYPLEQAVRALADLRR